jgi:hypothetical protein
MPPTRVGGGLIASRKRLTLSTALVLPATVYASDVQPSLPAPATGAGVPA